MISRRALFGLSVGAVAAVKTPLAAEAPAPAHVPLDVARRLLGQMLPQEVMMKFTNGYIIDMTPHPPVLRDDSEFKNVERA